MERTRLGTSMPTACLPGNGGHDAHAGGRQTQGDVVGEVRDLGDPDPLRGKDLEKGDDGTFPDARHLGIDIELLQRIGENLGGALCLIVDEPVLVVGPVLQHVVHGNPVGLRGRACLGKGQLLLGRDRRGDHGGGLRGGTGEGFENHRRLGLLLLGSILGLFDLLRILLGIGRLFDRLLDVRLLHRGHDRGLCRGRRERLRRGGSIFRHQDRRCFLELQLLGPLVEHDPCHGRRKVRGLLGRDIRQGQRPARGPPPRGGAHAVGQGGNEDRFQGKEQEQEERGGNDAEGVQEKLRQEGGGPGEHVQEKTQREKWHDRGHEEQRRAPPEDPAEEEHRTREKVHRHEECRPGEAFQQEPSQGRGRTGHLRKLQGQRGQAHETEKQQHTEYGEQRRRHSPAEYSHTPPLIDISEARGGS